MLRFIWLFVGFVVAWLSCAAAPPCAVDTFAFVPKSDGTIARFRVDSQTGKLNLLPSATDTGIKRPVSLVLSTDKKFLYTHPTFSNEKDGETSPAPLHVFRFQKDGGLHLVQSLILPGPVGQIVPHPGGSFVYALTAEGVFLLSVNRGQRKNEPSGGLHYLRKLRLRSGMAFDEWGNDSWWLTFSPSGSYLYNHSYNGFSGDGIDFLERFRVDLATGALTQDGVGAKGTGDAKNPDDPSGDHEPLWEAVSCIVNRTAFLGNWNTFRISRTDAEGRILARDSRFALTPNKRGYSPTPVLLPHPKLPIVIYGGSAADPYTVWRVSAPGEVEKVGEFAAAYDPLHKGKLFISPDGKFLYETSRNDKPNPPRVAVFGLSSNGTQATLIIPPTPLLPDISSEADLQWVFVTLPSKGAK